MVDAAFCMESGQVKTGADNDEVYVKMLQENVRITAPIAYGIATKYPNVRSLVNGFAKHGPLALEDVKVGFHVEPGWLKHANPIPEIREQERCLDRFQDRAGAEQALVQNLHRDGPGNCGDIKARI
jgi:hypothetical protein